MKTFAFRLERILSWRVSSLKTQELKLEQLRCSLELANLEKEKLALALSQAQQSTETHSALLGVDLHALAAYRERLNRETLVASQNIAAIGESIAKQALVVAGCDRNVRLLERLRDRRREEWQAGMDRELDELSADFAGGQWMRIKRDSGAAHRIGIGQY